ncbi:MAG: SDR family oxidoreductase [Ilumatobacteraceae bacterium]
MELSGKHTVITGAANGIGRAIAQRFHAQGAHVVLADRDLEPLRQFADELNAQRPLSAYAVATDVGTEVANASLVADAKAIFGPIDLFFANAGIGGGTDLSTSEENWNNAFNVNVHAHRWAAKYLLPDWLERGDGYFCSTASAAGLLSQIGSAPYSLTKHAALAFAEWLSITYGNRGLKVSCLCPQGVNTNMLRGADEINDGPSGNVVRTAGVVLEPEQVAEIVAQVIDAETFLILPHPEVADYVAKKATEHERWLAGMRKLQLRVLGL